MTSRRDLQVSRGRINALVVAAMRRDGEENLTDWLDKKGIARSTFYTLVRGRVSESGNWVKPNLDTLDHIARALGVPLHELVYLLMPDALGAPTDGPAPIREAEVMRVPVQIAGWVGAGPPQDYEYDGPPVYVEQAFARGRKLRAFLIRGDSMAAGKQPIRDGDIAIVDTNMPLDNATAVVARLVDDNYVCKVYKSDQYGTLLQSRNVDHTNGTPSAIPIEQVAEVVGRVVRIIHDFDVTPRR